VESEYAFTTSEDSGYVMDVQAGMNHFNGVQALAFARERQNVEGGDLQRGKDQQAVITAMIKKMLSPTMLLKANSILETVGRNVETNVSQEQINALIRYQLSKNPQWSILSLSAEGETGEDACYSAGGEILSVVYQDEESIRHIIEQANIVEEGTGTLEGAQTLN
jgi:anionic cell wall polymer biosynthesis LytR-Cps2A-Psr (LCP) family protein